MISTDGYMRVPFNDDPLTSPHCWAGGRIVLEVIINVCRVAWIRLFECSWNRNKRLWTAIPPARHLQLRTGNVELRCTARVVDSELLDSQQVFAGWKATRNLDTVVL
jgi:hypothetical protein